MRKTIWQNLSLMVQKMFFNVWQTKTEFQESQAAVNINLFTVQLKKLISEISTILLDYYEQVNCKVTLKKLITIK